MKKILNFIFSIIFCVLIFSCNQINGGEGDISFSVDNVIKAAQRAGASGDVFNVYIQLKGSYSKNYNEKISVNDLGTEAGKIIIPSVPINSDISVYVALKDNLGNFIYEGESEKFTVKMGVNKTSINIENPGWYVLWSKLKAEPKSAPPLGNLRITFFKELDENGETCGTFKYKYLEDLCFDKDMNIYTIEYDVVLTDMYNKVWDKDWLEICKYSYNDINSREVLYSGGNVTDSDLGNKFSCISTDGVNVYLGKFTNVDSSNYGKISKIYTIPCSGGNPVEFAKCFGGVPFSIDATTKDYVFVGVINDEPDSNSNSGTKIWTFNKSNGSNIRASIIKANGSSSNLYISDIQVVDDKLYFLNAIYDTEYRKFKGQGGDLQYIQLSRLTTASSGQSLVFSNKVNLFNVNFYGPIKFIALKPKKLIIADDGYDSSNNQDKNSVVTVDLRGGSPSATQLYLSKYDFNGTVAKGSSFIN